MAEQQTTLDKVMGGRVRLFQPKGGYRVAIDPVLLAAALDVPEGSRILDAGCGTGAALFCALLRMQGITGVGLERSEDAANLARQGVAANVLDTRAEIVCGDLAKPPHEVLEPFDAVMTNPPFYAPDSIPDRDENTPAHLESNLPLVPWIKACLKRLRPDGVFVMIHRTERLSEIIATLEGKAGAVTLYPLWPKQGMPAKRVIVTARKGRRSPSMLRSGLVLHNENGNFTPEAEAILRDGMPLETTA